MRLVSEMQQPSSPEPRGRWVLMPRPDARFVGRGSRSRARTRERRRRVMTVLGEAIGFTALIGAFPPLRPMWFLTAILAVFFSVYVLLLLRVRASTRGTSRTVVLPDADIAVLRAPSEAPGPRGRHAAVR